MRDPGVGSNESVGPCEEGCHRAKIILAGHDPTRHIGLEHAVGEFSLRAGTGHDDHGVELAAKSSCQSRVSLGGPASMDPCCSGMEHHKWTHGVRAGALDIFLDAPGIRRSRNEPTRSSLCSGGSAGNTEIRLGFAEGTRIASTTQLRAF